MDSNKQIMSKRFYSDLVTLLDEALDSALRHGVYAEIPLNQWPKSEDNILNHVQCALHTLGGKISGSNTHLLRLVHLLAFAKGYAYALSLDPAAPQVSENDQMILAAELGGPPTLTPSLRWV